MRAVRLLCVAVLDVTELIRSPLTPRRCCAVLDGVTRGCKLLRIVPSLTPMLVPTPMLVLIPLRSATWTSTIDVDAALILYDAISL